MEVCRHCKRKKINRPRGLCWTCYYTAGVRERYQSTSKFARRGTMNFNGPAKAAEPVDAAAGTPEKIEAMMRRAEAGQDLFVDGDAGLWR